MKKYISCPFIESGIHFKHDKVLSCCSMYQGFLFKDNYKGEPIDWEEILKKRKEVLEGFKNGRIYEECLNCYDLREDYWEEKDYIDIVFWSNWVHCNCSCVYCINNYLTHGHCDQKVKKSEYYDFLPILKDMIKKKVLSKNATVRCVGGEPAVLGEFDSAIKLLLKYGINEISILTSGVRYSKGIEKAIKSKKGNLTISIDCGCRETYNKIKKVDKFDELIKNIKRYLKAGKNLYDFLTLKYILIEGLNDNLEEIKKWLDLCEELKIKRVRMDFDYRGFLNGRTSDIPEHYYPLLSYMKKRAEEMDLDISTFSFVEETLEKYDKRKLVNLETN